MFLCIKMKQKEHIIYEYSCLLSGWYLIVTEKNISHNTFRIYIFSPEYNSLLLFILKNKPVTKVVKIPVDTFHSTSGEDANVEASATIQLHAWSIYWVAWPRRQIQAACQCSRRETRTTEICKRNANFSLLQKCGVCLFNTFLIEK
jgi:hypothetical protein